MDFAAQLANLERSANAARRRPANNDRSNGNDRPRQRQRREYEGRHPQQQNKVPFQSLQRAGYRIDPPPFAKEELPEKRPVRHICLLAVSIDDLPYEDIWKQWANPNPSNSHHQQNIEHGENPPIVSLVCHAKYPMNVKSEFLKQHLLQEPPTIGRGNQLADPVFRSHCPEWGSVEILRAMLDILHDGLLIGNATNVDPRFDPKRYLLTPWDQQEALENETNKASPDQNPPSIPPADVFVFISETCLPIQPLHAWCGALDANRSWLNARNRETPGTPRNKYELDQFSQIRMVPGDCRWKADQWMALCRSHAIAVREIDNHMPERERLWSKGFSHVSASDEMYFPTVLAVLQLLKENEELPEAQNEATNKVLVQKRAVTYTDWSQGMKNPASHTMADLARVVDAARKQKSLVARKFVGAIDIAEWERLCNTPTRAEGYSHEDDDAQLVDEGAERMAPTNCAAAFRPKTMITRRRTSPRPMVYENSNTFVRAPSSLQATMKFKSFEEMLGELQEEPLLLVYFYKDLCGPCKLQRRELAAASELLPAKVLAIDVEKWPNIGTRHNIGSLPCFLIIRQGQEVDRLEGLTPATDLLHRVSDVMRTKP